MCERDYIYTVQTGAFTGGLGDKGLENNSLLSAGVPWKEQVRKYPLHCFYCVYLTPGSGGGLGRGGGKSEEEDGENKVGGMKSKISEKPRVKRKRASGKGRERGRRRGRVREGERAALFTHSFSYEKCFKNYKT